MSFLTARTTEGCGGAPSALGRPRALSGAPALRRLQRHRRVPWPLLFLLVVGMVACTASPIPHPGFEDGGAPSGRGGKGQDAAGAADSAWDPQTGEGDAAGGHVGDGFAGQTDSGEIPCPPGVESCDDGLNDVTCDAVAAADGLLDGAGQDAGDGARPGPDIGPRRLAETRPGPDG